MTRDTVRKYEEGRSRTVELEEKRILRGTLLAVIRMEIIIDYGFDSNTGSYRYWGFNKGTAVSGPCITSDEAAIEAFMFLEKE